MCPYKGARADETKERKRTKGDVCGCKRERENERKNYVFIKKEKKEKKNIRNIFEFLETVCKMSPAIIRDRAIYFFWPICHVLPFSFIFVNQKYRFFSL